MIWPVAWAQETQLQTYGPIQPGETLWQIAGRLAAALSLDRERVMLALLDANPEAISPACNVHGTLRVGALLRVPETAKIAALDAAEVRQRLAEQGRQWREHRQGRQSLMCPSPPVLAEGSAQRGPTVIPESAEAPNHSAETSITQAPAPLSSTPEAIMPQTPAAATAPQPSAAAQPAHQSPLLAELTKPEPLLSPALSVPLWVLIPVALLFSAFLILSWRRSTSPDAVMPPRSLPLGHRDPRRLLPLAVLGGLLGAAMTILFREGIYVLEWLGGGGSNSGSVEAFSEHLAPWQRLLYPTLGGAIAGSLLMLVNHLPGRNTTDYMQAVAFGDGFLSLRHGLFKGLSSLFSVASGGSIGREGTMVLWAAMINSTLGRLVRLSHDDLRLLVAAGAAAGLAGISNAPLASTLFVAEIVLGSIALEHIGPLVVAAVIADVTVHELLGYAPSYTIPDFTLVSPWELGFYLLLGVAAGHLGPLVLHVLDISSRLFARVLASPPIRLALGGLIVGLISVYEPLVWGNGHGVVNSVLHSHWAWQALATVFLLKLVATAATYGSGAVGGLFTPSLFFGAMLGALVGTLAQWLLPGFTAGPSAYAVVGMGAFLAAATHAPLMSILMAYELTRDYQLVLPLMIAVISAHYTARQYSGVSPMYAESLLPQTPRKASAESAD